MSKFPPGILSLLPLCAASLSAAAQAPADTATTYKHALGLTASPVLDHFFTANRSLPLGLLYKRQVGPHRAWRFGVSLNQQYDERYDPQPKTNNAYTLQSFGVGLTIGQEWQRKLTKRWVGYAGIEVGAGFNQYKEEKDLQRFVTMNGADVILADNEFFRFVTYSGFVRPLMGVRYHFLPYLYASAETAVESTYSHTSLNSQIETTRTDTGELIVKGNGMYKENRFQTHLRPIQQVSLHYLFGHQKL